jgi:hypothetical protein
MSKNKNNKKVKRITTETYVLACRCGDFQADKEITGRLKSATYKNKKAYQRQPKHKTEY